jgi:hypothetical protein
LIPERLAALIAEIRAAELEEAIERLLADAERVLDAHDVDGTCRRALVIAKGALRVAASRAPTPEQVTKIDALFSALVTPEGDVVTSTKPWLSLPELGTILSLDRWSTKRWLDRWQIPHAKDGRNYRIWVRDLETMATTEWTSAKAVYRVRSRGR